MRKIFFKNYSSLKCDSTIEVKNKFMMKCKHWFKWYMYMLRIDEYRIVCWVLDFITEVS